MTRVVKALRCRNIHDHERNIVVNVTKFVMAKLGRERRLCCAKIVGVRTIRTWREKEECALRALGRRRISPYRPS
jgi:hypothetical protein